MGCVDVGAGQLRHGVDGVVPASVERGANGCLGDADGVGADVESAVECGFVRVWRVVPVECVEAVPVERADKRGAHGDVLACVPVSGCGVVFADGKGFADDAQA